MGTPRARETVQLLRDKITSGEWPLNSKIPTEAELVVELGVGRSTVREAVRSLANLGMLEPARSRGTFVRARSPIVAVLSDFISAQQAGELLGARRALEVEAARLAATHRTPEDLAALQACHLSDVAGSCAPPVERGTTPGQFHALIFAAAGNSLLAELHGGIMAGLRAKLARNELTKGIDDSARHRDHTEMLDAIAAGDADLAAAAAAAHADRDLIVVAPRT